MHTLWLIDNETIDNVNDYHLIKVFKWKTWATYFRRFNLWSLICSRCCLLFFQCWTEVKLLAPDKINSNVSQWQCNSVLNSRIDNPMTAIQFVWWIIVSSQIVIHHTLIYGHVWIILFACFRFHFRFVEMEQIHKPELLLFVGVIGLLVNLIGLVLLYGTFTRG